MGSERRDREFLTISQFCREYNVKRSTAYDARKSGRLRAVATGASTGFRVSRAEADRFMGVTANGVA